MGFKLFMGKKTFYHIKKENLILKAGMVGKITSLGISGFVMQGTNCLVQVVCNKMLFMYGGDMYVGIMTVINSVREILSVPGSTLGSGAQPVLGYNYGAKQYERVRKAIRFTAAIGFLYMLIAWLAVIIFPKEILSVFTTDKAMIVSGEHALKLYFLDSFYVIPIRGTVDIYSTWLCKEGGIFLDIQESNYSCSAYNYSSYAWTWS